LEAKFFKAGLERGIERGETLGMANGERHGREEGHQIGYEMGFAMGVSEVCSQLFTQDENNSKAAKSLLDSVSAISLDKPPRLDQVQRVRARFKVLESRTGMNLSRAAERSDISF